MTKANTALTRKFVIFKSEHEFRVSDVCPTSVAVRHVPDTDTTLTLKCLCYIGGNHMEIQQMRPPTFASYLSCMPTNPLRT